MRFSVVAAVAVFLCLAASASAQDPAGTEWPSAPRDFDTAEQLIATADLFPNSAGMQRYRLGVAIQANDRDAALAAARRLAALGAALNATSQGQLARVIGGEALAPISAQMAANATPVGTSEAYASIPVDHPLVEGLIWDERARRLYATSVVGRSLVALRGGNTRAVATGFGSLLGGAYDPARRLIWIASAEIETTPRDRANFVGLVAIDPRRPGAARRIAAPAGATPGDIAVARDGTVYASDGLDGALYRCQPGCSALETLFAERMFSGQGLAFSPDQRLLYIADRRYGLAALDRASGRLLKVAAPDDVMLDGIDGLVADRGTLIATQTAYAPARIVRLHLSPDGLAVTRFELLERANPDWGEVTLATIVGDRLVYVGGAQWDHYGANGAPNVEAPPGPTAIRSLRLR